MKTFLVLFLSLCALNVVFAADPDTRCFELRTYHANPGKLDALNTRFREHTVALFKKHGMVNIGYWMPVDNTNNLLIYMLAYPNAEAGKTAWAEFQADPDWRAVQKASEANGRLVGKVDSVLLTATDFSPAIAPAAAGEPRTFELRTYHAAPGKLELLQVRFREHTVALFDKHGMGQFGYWVPMDAKDGAGSTLIYILAHKSRDAAKESFKAFAADPDWVKAKSESEFNGPLTVKDGIESVFMAPTDYSPTK